MPISDAARKEACDFLRWVADDHFIFLGYREYRREVRDGVDLLHAVKGTGVGILAGKDETAKPRTRPPSRARCRIWPRPTCRNPVRPAP